MKDKNKLEEEIRKQQLIIFEMIDASIELALKKGAHELENGCNCIACVNRRKRSLFGQDTEWKYTL